MPAIRPQRGPQIKPKNLKAFSLRPSPDAYDTDTLTLVNDRAHLVSVRRRHFRLVERPIL
jgi:hypothetical protein